MSGEAASEKSASVKSKKVTSKRPLILLAILLLCFAIALTVGLVYNFHFKDDDDVDAKMKPMKRSGVVVDCLPEWRKKDPEEMKDKIDECEARGCVFQRLEESGAPWCSYPSEHGYKVLSKPMEIPVGYHVELQSKSSAKMFGQDIFKHVTVHVEMQTDNRVRVKIYPKNVTRWEIPNEALNIEQTNSPTSNETAHYNVTFTEDPFGIMVTRISTGAVIFDTSLPGMVLSDQYLQISTRLPNSNLYGFGEHRHEHIRHDMNWRIWSMFTRDEGPNGNWNLYGMHPVYMNVEDGKEANMVLLKNTNAMEVMLQPDPEPAVTFRTIGGILDFYIFLGDSPADVLKHYIKAIGQPVFPPYWSLGYHLSRWGYTNITDMRSVIDRNRDAGIPYDAQWADIDTFHKAFVFTYDKTNWPNFPALVDDLIAHDQHFITIVDPGIGANRAVEAEVKTDFPQWNILQTGEDLGIYVKHPNGSTLYGEVWPGISAYPDFTNPDVQDWWANWIRFYRNDLGIKVDALWIDMNEVSSFVPGSVDGCMRNNLNYPPYAPHVLGAQDDGKLFDKTLCMDAVQEWGIHYNVHSLYAHSMAMQTHKALETIFPNKRAWTMTRSSYVGTGKYATKWQGDNRADWSNMHYSIISLMEFGIFGFPMNGADICGFWLETTYELCVRWHQLGAFYPFARNHNGRGDDPNNPFMHQDPAAFGQDFVDLVKPVLMTRYKFLPYLYTLMYRAHADGEMVFKPLFFEFTEDERTLTIDTQFMLGSAFLLSPVLKQGATAVRAFIPKGQWFDYTMGEAINGDGKFVTLDTPLDKFNLHIRGGCIVPWQEPAVTTTQSRTKDLGLLIALNASHVANGELYWDDGVSKINPTTPNYYLVKFEMEKAGELTIRTETKANGFSSSLKFKTLEIYGLSRLPDEVVVNNVRVPDSNIKVFHDIVRVTGITNVPLAPDNPIKITWSIY